MQEGARTGPHAENILRDVGVGRGAPALRRTTMPYQQIKFYQAGSFVVGNRLLDPERALGAGPDGPLEHASPPATAPARAAARRSAPATRSTPRCAPPTGS